MTPAENKSKYHVMMSLLIIVWGLEYSIAKDALDYTETIVVLGFKYTFGLAVIALIAAKATKLRFPDLKDIPTIFGTTILGHIIYFYAEYTAMDTVPVANITVILGLLPITTALVDRFVFRRRLSSRLLVMMMACVAGIFLTIGADLASMTGGKSSGYILCVVALIAWLLYLFLTENITEKYGAIQVALYQSIIAFIITTPFVVPHFDEIPQMPSKILIELIYLGIVSEGICFLVEITGLEKLGPTISAVYSNFLPVTTAIFGLLLLHQELTPIQYVGGAIVIISGFFVIKEKEKLDRLQ